MFQKSLIFLIIAFFLASCSSRNIRVSVMHVAPAQQEIPSDVKSIAILTYEYNASNPQYKFLQNSMPDRIADAITRYGTYKVVDRDHIKTLITESQINASDDMDEETMAEVCKIANAQAIVVGKINNVSIEEHMEQKEIFIPAPDPNLPPIPKIFPYLVRRVTLDITSEMLHIRTKHKIVTNRFRKTYDSETDENVIGNSTARVLRALSNSFNALGGGPGTSGDEAFYQSQPSKVPNISSILTDLIEDASRSFINKISAHPNYYRVYIHKGSHPAIKTGMKWAKHNNYSRAIESFRMATNDPEEAGIAWYNMGVCYEYLRQNQEAKEAYDNALKYELNSDAMEDAMEGISRLQRYY